MDLVIRSEKRCKNKTVHNVFTTVFRE